MLQETIEPAWVDAFESVLRGEPLPSLDQEYIAEKA